MYIWDDECLLRGLCDLFNSFEARPCDFMPETLTEHLPAASVSGISGSRRIREYIDGSALWEVPFEIRLRIDGNSPSDRLRALSFFEEFGDWVEDLSICIPENTKSIGSIRLSDGPVKAAEYDSGDTEFRAEYVLKYRRCATDRVCTADI